MAQQAATCPFSLHNPDGGGLMAMPYGLAPAAVAPMPSTAPSGFVPRAGTPVVADLHVASTELGFQQGIAPAPERTVGYRSLEYLVVDVAAVDDGPVFSGGSHFVITTKGGALDVGLKAMDERERRLAAASIR